MRLNPHLFEVNAFRLLLRLSEKAGKPLTLEAVPEEEWTVLRESGIDIVWLMGVWKRSPGGRQKALNDPALREAYGRALPGWTEKDVTGSPYAVHRYTLDPFLGGEGTLAELKQRLNRLGLKLVLDFVPNHLAFDHPWTFDHPEYFVGAKEPEKSEHPDWFFEAKPGVFLAHGRDPYFPPWYDTVQINYFSPAAREAMRGELEKIAGVCDGVRCDMAMLPMNDIFERVWGPLAGLKPEKEFWPETIERIRAKHPDFIFMAEAYWDMEYRLQQMGFDFTYDKTLYDRLLHGGAQDVRAHLRAEKEYQCRSARFIENHDEKRAVEAFGFQRSLAAAAAAATVPGLRFFYEGQWEGHKVHTPIQLARERREKAEPAARNFYDTLLTTVDKPVFHEGRWQLLDAPSPELLAWSWELNSRGTIVIINYSPAAFKGAIQGKEVDLGPWGVHIIEV